MNPADIKDKEIFQPELNREVSYFNRLIRICALIVFVIGAAALCGWFFDFFSLAAIGKNFIPMAPSTALLFILFGIVLFLSPLYIDKLVYRWIVSFNLLITLISLVLSVFSYQGIYLDVEHFGFSLPIHSPGLTPMGHMSVITAISFLLASLSLLIALITDKDKRFFVSIAYFFSIVFSTVNYLLFFAYLFGTPLFYGSSIIPPALPTTLAFIITGVALFAFSNLTMRQSEFMVKIPYKIYLIYIFLATGIISAGFLFAKQYEKEYGAEVGRGIKAVADLKMEELVRWRREIIADAGVINKNPLFSRLVMRFFKNPKDKDAEGELRGWLSIYPVLFDYDEVYLFDAKGRGMMFISSGVDGIAEIEAAHLPEVLSSGEITLIDFHRDKADQRVSFDIMIPIFDLPAGNKIIGIIAFCVDPEKNLYPSLQSWPTPSKTAETLLVRRAGEDVLFLNPIKFKKDAALNFRIPLTKTDVMEVKAVRGQIGIVEGVDYRGVSVSADIRSVLDSPWFLITKMDISEVYAPARKYLRLVAGAIMILLFSAGTGLSFVLRQQNLKFYRAQYKILEELKESRSRYQELFISSRDAVMTLEPPLWMFTSGNPATVEMFQAKNEADFISHGPWQLSPERQPDGRASADVAKEMIGIAMSKGYNFFEWVHKRINGEPFFAEVTLSRIEQREKIYLHAIVKDISERKNAEEAIRASLKEKELLLKEVHHRVKNNMQLISSMLRLQSRTLKDSEAVNLLEETERRIKSIALIHEKFYRSESLTDINISKYMKELLTSLYQAYGIDSNIVSMELDIKDIKTDISSAVPFGLVLNELISNCMKHAFPGGRKGRIKVSLKPVENGKISLKVADDGVGVPEGFDFRNTESLGLQLVTSLMEKQLGGEISLDKTHGTEFTLVFPGKAHV